MAKKSIPDEIKQQVAAIVMEFNKHNKKGTYTIAFKGKFAYLDKITSTAGHSHVGRLTYNGNMDNWDFAVYKYSRNGYDPDEWFFPGREHLNGTIEGALKTGLHLYN